LKDVLIVKFERSSWRIVYTGNEVLPFVFQKINTELGAESTFSLVPFDQGVFAVGNVGITTDSGVNVERIDQKIPDIVFTFQNDKEGPERIHGIRDFARELVYWTYPYSPNDTTYPDSVLVYNYRNGTYATYNDQFTCYGYFQRTTDLTWADLDYLTWNEWKDAWNTGAKQALYLDVCAGNQNGYVVSVGQKIVNDPSFTITAITPGSPAVITVPDHNMQTGQVVKITGVIGTANILNDGIYQIVRTSSNTFELWLWDGSAFDVPVGSTYIGGGEVAYLNNMSIVSKRFSPFYEAGKQVRLGYVDFLFDKTSAGKVRIDLFIDEDDANSLTDTSVLTNQGLLGTYEVNTGPENLNLIPFQANQAKIWHRIFTQSISQNFQFKVSLSPFQMSDPDSVEANFVMHAIAFYLSPNARMTQ
jgi:hypothetical protein